MIKHLIIASIVLLSSKVSNAQFYYKDIVSNLQLKAEMAKLKEMKYRSVKITSFEDDGKPSDGFLINKSINKHYTSVETFTRTSGSSASVVTSSFTKEGLLLKTIDSSAIAVNSSVYTYDEQGRIKNIQSKVHSNDDDFVNEIKEDHNYQYDEKGVLQKMYRIKNGSDTIIILFSADEQNNITIEKDTKSGSTYYYYYDSKKRLTDVVHLNPFNQQLLPDYIFEYNNVGNITQMTSTEEGGTYYYVWKYMYADGLRIREKCFSKERRLLGTIEYEYK